MKAKRRGKMTGPPVPHQATQAGTGGSLPDFGGSEPAKAPPSVLDNWLTLEGFLDTPREYWEMLVALRLRASVPTKEELRREWVESSTIEMQFLRKVANPSTTEDDLLAAHFEHERPSGFTMPDIGVQWSAMTLQQWLTFSWLRRSVSITYTTVSTGKNYFGSGYIVGPRHVLTAAHLLPWTRHKGNGATTPSDPTPVDPQVDSDGTIDLANMPVGSDFAGMNLRVHLFQGVYADKAEPPYVIGRNEVNTWLPVSHSPVEIQTAYPPYSGFSGIELAGDYVVLIMDDTFAGLTSALGLGWDPVMDYSKMVNTMLVDSFVRTGWGVPVSKPYADLCPPPSPYKGYGGPTATARTEYSATFGKAIYVGPPTLKWLSIKLESQTSDATPGDSGSAYVHIPALNGETGPTSVGAVWVAESGEAIVKPGKGFGKYVLLLDSVNHASSGLGLYNLWWAARNNYP